MHIVGLHVENIKRVKAVSINPKGNVVVIGGKNGNGKSSTLDAIAMTIGGAKLIPEKPIREGETEAKIVVDMGEYVATRHWTSPEKSYLKLEHKEAGKLANAQTLLDKLVGNLAFDPLEFSTMEPSKRFAVLKQITGLDFSALDQEYKIAFDARREIGRMGETTKAQLDHFKDLQELVEPSGIEDIKKQREELERKNHEIRSAETLAQMKIQNISNLKAQASDKRAKIEALKDEVANIESLISKEEIQLLEAEKTSKTPLADMSHLDKAMADYHAYQANLKRLEQKKSTEEQIEKYRSEWNKHDAKLKEINESKEKQLAAAKMPIVGLSMGDKEVLYNGIPFAQLSTSEQIRVSFAMAMAMNPKLKVAIIKNGSLLDSDAMESIAKLATENQYQLWIEKVANGPEAGMVYIEDGEVSGT